MRLVSYRHADTHAAGVLDGHDAVLDVGQLLGRDHPVPMRELLATPGFPALVEGGSGRAAAREAVELLSPVPEPRMVLAAGMNYARHVAETGLEPPKGMPGIFAKLPSSVSGPFDGIPEPDELGEHLDYEAELALVVGVEGAAIPGTGVRIAGITVANDVSLRDLQIERNQLTLGKGIDGYCPMGPVLLLTPTLEELLRPRAISSTVNGAPRQSSTTADMIFPPDEIVRILARHVTLAPGDVILTGSPEGVGMGLRPQRWLRAGDVVACRIEDVGEIANPVVVRAAEAVPR